MLGPQNAIATHRLALPHREVAAAIETMRASSSAQSAVKLAFELLVLTAARPAEVRLATWAEMDMTEQVWTISALRMKAKREQRVPLCRRAVEILDAARRLGDANPLVFPMRSGKPIVWQHSPRHRRYLRWSRFFGPLAKVYSRISGRHWNDDETATPVHSELQEAGGARGAAGGPPRAGDRGQARNPSEPGGRLEAPGGRRVGGCLRRQQSIARVGARDDDPRLAREDRRVDGGAGFFSARLPTLSRAARLELIERDGALSIRRQCALLGISRSSVYYTPRAESAANLALMRRMDALSLQYPFYGSRQMARHLRREGVLVGRRRVRRLMRLMGLEALYRRPRTSGSQPGHRIYPYLLRDLTIDRPDQVWCADITYIPVTAGFLYLVAIMDWASRHVLSWRLSNTMDSGFCVEALEAALRTGTPDIFNTDQGSQFTSAAFTERVLAAGAQCSMDGRGRCLDNVFIERLWRSLKYEAVYLHELADGFAAERVIGAWMTFYGNVRPHSALGGRTPAEAYGEERAA